MTQDELKALIGQMNFAMDDAMATQLALANQAKYMQARLEAGAQAVLAVLAKPWEDPALTVVGPITTTPPVEQPVVPPGA